MGNTKAIFATGTTVFTAAVTIIACGSDHKANPDAPVAVHDSAPDSPTIDAAPDAPSFDFTCSGNSAPTPSANVTVTGTVDEVGFNGSATFMPLPAAHVDLCTGNCNGGNNLGSGATDGSGNFSLGPVATGGTAIDGYVKLTHTGDRTILGYPSSPFAMSSVQPIITFQDIIIQFGSQFGCNQQATNGMVGLLVTDCANHPIGGTSLTVSVQQGGSNVGDAPIDASALSPMAAGFYLICNVPPGATTTVSATYNNMSFRAHDVQVTAGTTTETIVRPGF